MKLTTTIQDRATGFGPRNLVHAVRGVPELAESMLGMPLRPESLRVENSKVKCPTILIPPGRPPGFKLLKALKINA